MKETEAEQKASLKKKKQSVNERFSKNQITSMLVEKDASRLGCVSKAAAVPLIHVLDSQIDAATFDKDKEYRASQPIDERRKKLAALMQKQFTTKNMRDEIDKHKGWAA